MFAHAHTDHAHTDPSHLTADKIPSEAVDHAWFIFRYFIASGSPYEYSFITARRRKEIMLKLARPDLSMFLDLEKSVFRLVRDQYINFSFSSDFEILIAEVMTRVQ